MGASNIEWLISAYSFPGKAIDGSTIIGLYTYPPNHEKAYNEAEAISRESDIGGQIV